MIICIHGADCVQYFSTFVDLPTVIHTSSFLAVILYTSIGLLGSMALPNVSDNMLESMMSGAFGTLMQLGASLLPLRLLV